MTKFIKPGILYRLRGIAVFGAPGSGKTSIAKSLSEELGQKQYIEACEQVIIPSSFLFKLPESYKMFFNSISTTSKSTVLKKKISRNQARKIFIDLKNKYSPNIIAKTLEYIHQKNYHNKFIVISGVRGYENVLYFKKRNYYIVFLKPPKNTIIRRLASREHLTLKKAQDEYNVENRLYSTSKIQKIADMVFDTAKVRKTDIVKHIIKSVKVQECKKCVNNTKNPTISINRFGLCNICEQYKKGFNKAGLAKELKFFKSLIGSGKGKYDAMVGISGGKDSTATLYTVKQLGFTPLAFTFDIGYYPQHIFSRSVQVAKKLKVDHIIIKIQKYIRKVDLKCYQKTADLYDEEYSQELKQKFLKLYQKGREHYSIKCKHSFPFVRSCQLCRRTVIRAYYAEALKHGVRVVVLGINEWTGLSKSQFSKKCTISAIRRLKPYANKPAVYIVHLPFLLQRTVNDTQKILKKLQWGHPKGEALIESNANSCLLARAAENKARKLLGFHPDSTRLAREVTVGFITKNQAKKALDKIHNYKYSVHQVLQKAKIL